MGRKVIAVVGPTATGKTALAIEIARRIGGEIVNADSRQVYRGMDIGTAKPTAAERCAVPHYLFDHVRPDEAYSLGVYREQALAVFHEIWARGHVPVLTGGTGQYTWALLESWSVPEIPPDFELRERLERECEALGTEATLRRLQDVDPVAAARIDVRNLRRVVRALEVFELTGRPISDWQSKGDPGFSYEAFGIALSRPLLDERINARVDAMFAAGFEDEVRRLRSQGYQRDLPAMSSIGYSQVYQLLDGEISREMAIEETRRATRRLARKQAGWFRLQDTRLCWLQPGELPAFLRD